VRACVWRFYWCTEIERGGDCCGVVVARRERERERETHTHTHTHKDTYATKQCRKLDSLDVCSRSSRCYKIRPLVFVCGPPTSLICHNWKRVCILSLSLSTRLVLALSFWYKKIYAQ
jgi:hypothetical protein